jgi:hypothetical protein
VKSLVVLPEPTRVSGNIAPQDKIYRSFEEARKYVHTLGLGNRDEWNAYCSLIKRLRIYQQVQPKLTRVNGKGAEIGLGLGEYQIE